MEDELASAGGNGEGCSVQKKMSSSVSPHCDSRAATKRASISWKQP